MGWKQFVIVAVVAIVSKSWLESYLQPKLPRTVNGFCDPAFKRVEDEFRGLLEYNATVTKYWPEFGQKEKGNITVGMLMSHQAGLISLDTPVDFEDFINNRKKVEDILAAQGTVWPAGSHNGYHTLTYGMYVDTLIQKVDPKGRSMGKIFQEDIASVYDIDFYMNTPKDQFHRAARIHFQSNLAQLMETLFAPRYRSVFANVIFNPESLVMRSLEAVNEYIMERLNNPDVREVVMSSVTGTGTARGLAKLYGILGTDGMDRNNNMRLLSQELVTSLSTPIVSGTDVVILQSDTINGPGTMIKESPEESLSLFGHTGQGGQVGFADKKRKLGIGYVTNFISIYGLGDDPRYLKLEEAIYESVKRLED